MRKMKESGIEWIGEIPEGWEVRKIKTFSPVLRGASPRPIDDPQYFDESGKYSWVRISDVSAAKKYLYSAGDRLSKIGESKSVKIHAGDLFVSICASVGKACISKIDCCIHDGFVYFPSLDRRMVNFLYYIFTSGECYSGLGKLGTQLNLNTNTVADIYIPFSSIEHCAYIADYLDAKCARIDEAVELIRQSMEKLRAYKLSLITEAVTKGLDPNVPMKDSGISWIGEIPEKWGVVRLKFIAPLQCGYAFKADRFSTECGVPLVRMSNLKRGKLDLEEAVKIQEEDIVEDFFLKEHDILLGLSGSLGDTGSLGNYAIVSKTDLPCLLNQRVGRFIIANKILPNFLVYIIATEFFKRPLELDSTGTAQFNISPTTIGEVFVPLLPLAEQQRIADYLDAKCARIDALLEEKERLLNRLAEYKKSLIFECVTGKREVSA